MPEDKDKDETAEKLGCLLLLIVIVVCFTLYQIMRIWEDAQSCGLG